MTGRPTRICLWGGGYSSRNVGDQAILISITRLLRARLPDADITVLARDPALIKRYMAAEGLPVRAVNRWRQLASTIRALMQADLFIVGGGVPFYDDLSQVVLLVGYVVCAKLGGARAMTYALSTQTLSHPLSRWAHKAVLNRMDAITAREPWTQEHLSALGLRHPVVLTADPVVTLIPAPSARVEEIFHQEQIVLDPNRPLIGITTRHLTAQHSAGKHHYRRYSEADIREWERCMAQAADRLTGLGQVVFIPMNTAGLDNDWETISEVRRLMSRASDTAVISHRYTAPETMGLIGRCAFLLGSRVHSVIMAAASTVPFVAVAYDRKLTGIARRFHMGPHTHELVGLRGETLIASIDAAWDERDKLRGQLKQHVGEFRAAAERNADLAAALCAATTADRG